MVKKETNRSHVMQYGDMKISQQDVGDFQGHSDGFRDVFSLPVLVGGLLPSSYKPL